MQFYHRLKLFKDCGYYFLIFRHFNLSSTAVVTSCLLALLKYGLPQNVDPLRRKVKRKMSESLPLKVCLLARNCLSLLHSEGTKLHRVLVVVSAIS